MDDYLTRVDEAVHTDQPAAPGAIIKRFGYQPLFNAISAATEWMDGRMIGISVAAFEASLLAATSETPQTIQCNACDWIGSSADAHYLGGREPIGPLCPECHETTGPADDAATLRSAIRAMAAMLQAREWAEHVSADPIVTDLEVQITELVGTATKLREQNATLGEAISLQHANGEALAERVMQAEAQNAALVAAMQNIADEFVPGDEQKLYGTPTDALDRIRSTARATLASAKGGAA